MNDEYGSLRVQGYFLAFAAWCNAHNLQWKPVNALTREPSIFRLEFTNGKVRHVIRLSYNRLRDFSADQMLDCLVLVLTMLFKIKG